MARLPRLSAPGLPHLVLQSGHNGGAIVLDAADRDGLLELLAEAATHCGVAVHAYALGSHRLVLLATPAAEGGLSRLMQRLGRRHAAAFNRRHGRSGTLWDGRFRAALVEPAAWLVPAMRHVEGTAADADPLYRSSAPHHRGQAADPLVSDHPAFWALGNTPFEREAAYRLLLSQPLPAAQADALEHAMAHGWALGSELFLGGLADGLARPVQPRRAGRPRKAGSRDAA